MKRAEHVMLSRIVKTNVWAFCAAGLAAVAPVLITPAVAAETVAQVASRGQSIRVLVDKPAAAALGSVVLLAGGHGNLDIAPNGTIGWGKGNQVVRTRGDYAKAGFIAVVPDIAPDLKTADGGVSGYRWSSEFARDLGAVVKYARGLAQPVHVIATSRGTISAAKLGAAITSGPERPDSFVLTAGMLMAITDKQPSVQKNVPGLGGITQPVFLVHHAQDGCAYTPASAVSKFKPLLTGSKRVDVKILTGGESGGASDPCQAQSHHGFLGQDAEVVRTITDWLKALPKSGS
jgi:hypothetical protein